MTSSYAWIVFRKVLSSVSSNIQIRNFLRLGSISSETSNAIKNLRSEFEWRCRSSIRCVPSSTQLYKVSDETAIRYLKELEDKYAPGSTIADVPSNKTGSNKGIFKVNNGKVLKGQMILEVPVQEEKISPKVLEYANDYRIKIRDIKGKFYN